MAGVVLVLAVLVLGGLIATIGDRLGTKVGKARLSLFGMRPRKTAVAITILTGGIISATTLGILLTASSQLRTGLFELESIQSKLKKARRDLEATQAERQRIEQERDQALRQQVDVRKRLDATNRELDESISRQQQTQSRLDAVAQRSQRLRGEAERLQREQQVLVQQRDEVARQIVQRNQEIAQRNQAIAQRDRDIAQQESQLGLQKSQLNEQNFRLTQREQEISERDEQISKRDEQIAEREQEISERDEQIAEREQEISERDEQIAKRDDQIALQRDIVASGEMRVDVLERAQDFLAQEILLGEQELLRLRSGNLALSRLQVLTTRVVRVFGLEATQQVIVPILQDANRTALEAVRPGTEEEQIIQITRAQVERLSQQIQDGQEYVVQILSEGNFIRGEERVFVFPSVVPNQIIFPQDELIAAISIELPNQDVQSFLKGINLLVEKSRFRARQTGMVCDRIVVADDRRVNLARFYEQLQVHEGTLTLQALTSAPTYTVGPLRIDLAATRGGVELFRTSAEEISEPFEAESSFGAEPSSGQVERAPLNPKLGLGQGRGDEQPVVSYRARCRE